MSDEALPATHDPMSTTSTGRVGGRRPLPGDGPPGRPSLGWTELVVGALTYLVLSVAVVLVVLRLTREPSTVVVVTGTGLATLAAAGIALAVRVRSLPALGLRPTTVRWVLLGAAGGLLAWLVNRVVIIGYMALTGDLSNPQEYLASASAVFGWEFVGVLAAGAVLVPLAEELLFRGVGYGALRRYGVAVATVASSLLFGIAHGINVVLPAAIVLGIVTAVLYERSRSIWPGVLAHVLNNTLVFTAALILL
jgi:hypothetical protein